MKYNIITYKLNKNVKPDEILRAVNVLMQEFSAQYQNCLFRAISLIGEYEHDGVLHSNKTQNAVVRICKSYPHLNAFLKQTSKDKGEGHIDDELSICNFSDVDYSETGKMDPSTIFEIASKIPRPYNPNNVEIILDGICFSQLDQMTTILPSENGFGLPVGNYILYERESYGSEKHSYIHFSADNLKSDRMRELFLEFTKIIPGKYEGTEVKNH